MASRGSSGSRMALASSVLLLGAGYVLLVAAPLVLQRLPLPGRTWDGTGSGAWFPAAAASGLAIGGAAALIYVLGRLVREVEHQPYACLAPVLGVFSAFVLAGLHVKLPIPGLLSEHFGVLAMAVAVVGGALVQQGGLLSGLIGALLTVLPTAVLVAILWLGSGQGNLQATLSAMDSQVRVFAVLMSVSSLAMLAIALVARAIMNAPRNAPVTQAVALPSENTDEWLSLRIQADQNTPRLPMALGIPDNESHLPWNDEFPTGKRSGTSRWLIALLVLAALGVAGALGHRLYQQHQAREEALALAQRAEEDRKDREAAALKAKADLAAAEQAQAAQERLNALLNAPRTAAAPAVAAPAVAPAEGAAAEPVQAEQAKAEAAAQALAEAHEAAEEETARDAAAAERKQKRAENRAKRRMQKVKAERAEKAKSRAERQSDLAAQRTVSKTLSSSNDPILGLLEE